MTGLQRGPTTEKWEYDSQGRIVSRVFADGKTWSYTYLDKVQDDERKATYITNQREKAEKCYKNKDMKRNDSHFE